MRPQSEAAGPGEARFRSEEQDPDGWQRGGDTARLPSVTSAEHQDVGSGGAGCHVDQPGHAQGAVVRSRSAAQWAACEARPASPRTGG